MIILNSDSMLTSRLSTETVLKLSDKTVLNPSVFLIFIRLPSFDSLCRSIRSILFVVHYSPACLLINKDIATLLIVSVVNATGGVLLSFVLTKEGNCILPGAFSQEQVNHH